MSRLALLIAAVLLLAGPARHGAAEADAARAAPACSAEETRAALAPAASPDDEVRLTCRLSLRPGDVVTRRIVIEGHAASGTEIDCAGGRIGRSEAQPTFPNATIEIRSVEPGRSGGTGRPIRAGWDRPTDVAIRNCTVAGPIRIWGMGRNGQAEAVKRSSHALGHTERAQAAAPSRITLEKLHLAASGGTPLYLAPGVTQVTLRDSQVTGQAVAIAIYMDAESGSNALLANRFDISTGREVIAVDGSARNRIVGNRFRMGIRGGIYLYRNCGEGGTVRHQTPSHNLIADNRFAYAFPLHLPAISIGARGGWGFNCEEDAGYPFGSSADNGDNATDNRVEGNVVE